VAELTFRRLSFLNDTFNYTASMAFLDTSIEYLKGVGPDRAKTLKEDLEIETYHDLLFYYPFRYIDRTKFFSIRDIATEGDYYQLKGVLRRLETIGEGRVKRLVGTLRDETGSIEMVWFQSINWLEKSLEVGREYVVYGRVSEFNGRYNLPHPELEEVNRDNSEKARTYDPVYKTSEKLARKGLDARGIRRLSRQLLDLLAPALLPEILPQYILQTYRLISRNDALRNIHFPETESHLKAATRRLKFEELFMLQISLLQIKLRRNQQFKGIVFSQIGPIFNQFYNEKLPFPLTGAQKRVLKEIRIDLGSGGQMNRLVQGDVGSGKTVVALMAILMALDNGYQASFMAPTEILAQQHYAGITEMLQGMEVEIAYLSGNIKGKKRQAILEKLAAGEIKLLIGTHALIEDEVRFERLGIAIIDEQHRFGVEQRSKLWKKNTDYPPHILVMTATPIPRTLAMTVYGDLEVSKIDELPPGRKPVTTLHKTEHHRMRVVGLMKEEIAKGRQVYVVFPMIEETEKADMKNLMQGYDTLLADFPMPNYQISVVHGKMKAIEKDMEMARFVKGETQIMIATTVIEVGVNVPNASLMVVENAERFGLSQLHQLRGRVGRGADQSFCILMTGLKLTHDGRDRIKTMVETNDGFVIAEADLKLRGPGNIEGTQQSGMINFLIADLMTDGPILEVAREMAMSILKKDPELAHPDNAILRKHLLENSLEARKWSRIS
jgi:ATP-dependent DNA helicase RecG